MKLATDGTKSNLTHMRLKDSRLGDTMVNILIAKS